jgi:hypothetical protein
VFEWRYFEGLNHVLRQDERSDCESCIFIEIHPADTGHLKALVDQGGAQMLHRELQNEEWEQIVLQLRIFLTLDIDIFQKLFIFAREVLADVSQEIFVDALVSCSGLDAGVLGPPQRLGLVEYLPIVGCSLLDKVDFFVNVFLEPQSFLVQD